MPPCEVARSRDAILCTHALGHERLRSRGPCSLWRGRRAAAHGEVDVQEERRLPNAPAATSCTSASGPNAGWKLLRAHRVHVTRYKDGPIEARNRLIHPAAQGQIIRARLRADIHRKRHPLLSRARVEMRANVPEAPRQRAEAHLAPASEHPILGPCSERRRREDMQGIVGPNA